MTFGQFIAVLRARWIVFVAVLGGMIALALAISLLLPPRYKAEASVVVDFKPDLVSAAALGGGTSMAFIATQVDIINSPTVAQRVVRDLKLLDQPALRQQWRDITGGEGNFELWVMNAIQQYMDVVPSRVSNVITITYKAPDPKFAAAVANAFMHAYIATALDLRVDPARKYSSFFDTQLKESRDALEKAQGRLSAFQRANGIIATDERLDVENARLNELSSQLVGVTALLTEATSRNAAVRSGQTDRMQEALASPLVIQLRADINRGEAKLKELGARLGDNNPQVVEARASLAETRQRLDAELQRVSGSVGVADSIMRQREVQLRAEMEAQRTRVLKMKATRDEGAVLQREVENAQQAFNAISQRLNAASLESQTTQSNVNVLSEARAPNDPSFPRLGLNLVIAIVLGIIFGILGALLREYSDRRIRSESDVVNLLGLPVVGVLPRRQSRLIFRRAAPVPLLAGHVGGGKA